MAKAKASAGGLEHLIAGALLTAAKQLRESGQSPTHAVQLAAVALLGGVHGKRPFLDLGVPEGTVNRWWRELEATAGGMGELTSEDAAEVINSMLEGMGVPLRVVDPHA